MNNPRSLPKGDGAGDSRAGFFYALAAYGLWGFLPLYMKLVDHIDPVEVVANRAFWSLPVAGVILFWLGRTSDILPTLKSPKRLGVLAVTAGIISVNWGIYVWAIAVGRTVEAALGYYINPLISVLMGAVFLGERFTRLQIVAIGLATLAVAILTVGQGALPWVSLVLAFSFALYGYLRKTVDVGPTQGFLVEVLLLSVIALPYLGWITASGASVFFDSASNMALLIGCGPVTAIPLILYAFGAKKLRLSTIGLMQYIAPTLIFLIGVFVFKEPFGLVRLFAFTLIWLALVLYTWSMLRQRGVAQEKNRQIPAESAQQ